MKEEFTLFPSTIVIIQTARGKKENKRKKKYELQIEYSFIE